MKDVMAQDATSLKSQITQLREDNYLFADAISEMYAQL